MKGLEKSLSSDNGGPGANSSGSTRKIAQPVTWIRSSLTLLFTAYF